LPQNERQTSSKHQFSGATPVDGSEILHHLGFIKISVDNGMNYQPPVVHAGFLPTQRQHQSMQSDQSTEESTKNHLVNMLVAEFWGPKCVACFFFKVKK